MVKVSLQCAIVGNSFDVEIDDAAKVSKLKDAIWPKIENKFIHDDKFKRVIASDLKLFLATKGGAWLSSLSEDVKKLKKGEQTDLIEALTEEDKKLEDEYLISEYLQNRDSPKSKQIHVLVEVPEEDSSAGETRKAKLTPLAKMLRDSGVVGDLPMEGAILNLFEWTDDNCGEVMDIKMIDDIVHFTSSKFYVRKEILCVLENFKKIYQEELDTGTLVNKQMVLMGSPGTGKSCILALMCFHIAVQYQRPVIWFRQVIGGRQPTTTRLFYQGKYYEWEDQKGEICESLYNAMGNNKTICWVFLDGLTQADVRDKAWYNMYKVLATSGQFSPNSEAMTLTKMCLVPLWRQTDLEDFGHRHMNMDQGDVDARLFVSGGSLREFLNYDSAEDTVKAALDCIATPEHAENLLTMHGLGSSKQIDRIRMRGVEDRNNANHYVSLRKWNSCVMSKLVLQHLAAMMKPNFFEKLMSIAQGMHDDRLEGAAFEGYFHSLVRHHGSICVEYCKYDNVDRRTRQDWKIIMKEEGGLIEVNKPSVATCIGGKDECVAVMESWASNPSEMDYWTPATSLCETIDAVARWRLPDSVVWFCFLQLTKATKHKCDEAVLWKLAKPFLDKQLPVCYIALLPHNPEEDKRPWFRFDPAVIANKRGLDRIPLYVARFHMT